MYLDLDRQPPGHSNLEVETTLELAAGDEVPARAVLTGSLQVDLLESRALIRGTLKGEVEVTCDRCLAPFALGFEVAVELLVLRDVAVQEPDEDGIIHQRRGAVDLLPSLREACLLAVPQKRLCRRDCRGLCPQCGADLNRDRCDCASADVDPRWAGLPEE